MSKLKYRFLGGKLYGSLKSYKEDKQARSRAGARSGKEPKALLPDGSAGATGTLPEEP